MSLSQNLSYLHVVGQGKFLSGKMIDKSVKDVYGGECAGLVIVSDLNGLSYGAYEGIVKTNHKPGEDLLYLSSGEKVITVYKNGYESLIISLKDYGIKLKKGKVWRLRINGANTVSDPIPVNIITNPADTRVSIDGELMKSTGTVQVKPGSHIVKITRNGYATLEKTIEVDSVHTFFPFSLKPKKLIPVEIMSAPSGATIFLNDINKGTTNQGMFLYPGKYKVSLSKAGYIDTTTQMTIPDTGKKLIAFRLNQDAGHLHLNVTPADANVIINDNNFNGQRNITLTPGTYPIAISKLGYYSRSDTIKIALNKTINRSYILKKEIGTLQFSIVPLGAQVSLFKNGHTIKSWQGLNVIDSLQVGTYTFRAMDPGYSDMTDSVLIQENMTSVKNLIMKRLSPGDHAGNLAFTIQPTDASVELLKGNSLVKTWKGSTIVNGLTPGYYEIIARKTGFYAKSKVIQIQPDQQTDENVSLKTSPDIRFHHNSNYAGSFSHFWGISVGLGNSYGNVGMALELRYGHFTFHIGAGTHTYVNSSEVRNHILVAGGVKYILLKSYARKTGVELFVDAQYGSLADPIKAYGPSLLLGGTFWIGRHIGVTTSWGGSYDIGEVNNKQRLIIGSDLVGLSVKF